MEMKFLHIWQAYFCYAPQLQKVSEQELLQRYGRRESGVCLYKSRHSELFNTANN